MRLFLSMRGPPVVFWFCQLFPCPASACIGLFRGAVSFGAMDGSGISIAGRERSRRNLYFARLRRAAVRGLIRPQAPLGWQCGTAPPKPVDFLDGFELPGHSCRLLQHLNPHPLDSRIVFFEHGHVYTVDGVPTLGSVTSLVQAFCESFDADLAIQKMMGGRNWPRPEYLRADGSPMNEDDIKADWKDRGRLGANQGTWIHHLLELHLNRVSVREQIPEMELFFKFLATLRGYSAYRTEWEIFGVEENLAGSIDFVASSSDGFYMIVDWKRTKGLKGKYENVWRSMLPPLEHLHDCSGTKYRLQLNCYMYLLEKYYGLRISRMVVVCVHPDCGSHPFVDEVPFMPVEVNNLMAWQRDRARSARASSASGDDGRLQAVDDAA